MSIYLEPNRQDLKIIKKLTEHDSFHYDKHIMGAPMDMLEYA